MIDFSLRIDYFLFINTQQTQWTKAFMLMSFNCPSVVRVFPKELNLWQRMFQMRSVQVYNCTWLS